MIRLMFAPFAGVLPAEQDLFGQVTPWELGLLIAGIALTTGLVILFTVIVVRAGRDQPDRESNR